MQAADQAPPILSATGQRLLHGTYRCANKPLDKNWICGVMMVLGNSLSHS
jgi:hypothetical protein